MNTRAVQNTTRTHTHVVIRHTHTHTKSHVQVLHIQSTSQIHNSRVIIKERSERNMTSP